MRTIGKRSAAFAILLAASVVRADSVAIPVIGQPSPFYGAAGTGVTVEAIADRTELTPEEIIVLTLRIQHLANAADVQRPNLSDTDSFNSDFQIEDIDAAEQEAAGMRVFRYQLRPRRASVASIPVFSFPYYDPKRPQPPDRPDFPFLTARTKPISIRIRKSIAPVLPAIPLDVPDFAAAPAEPASRELPNWAWYWAALAPPILVGLWCVVWTILHPAGARLARRRRSRAARIALRRLHTLGRREPTDLAGIVECVERYLAERHSVVCIMRTPNELSRQLIEAGASADNVAKCGEFFRSADTARFAPGPTISGDLLVAEAEQLIRQQEEGA